MRWIAPAFALLTLSCSLIADTGEAAEPGPPPGGFANTPDVSNPPLPTATPLRPIAPPFDPSRVVAEYAGILREFQVRRVTGDIASGGPGL